MPEATTRWRFHDPALLWIFPFTYAAHIVEEGVVSAPILLWHVRLDAQNAIASFMTGQLIGFVLMLSGISLAGRTPRFHWVVPALATAILLNTAGHMMGSVAGQEYSAGLITAIVFWVPLALLTFVRVLDQASQKTVLAGTLVGIAIEGVVLLVAALLAGS
jgi:hypothetical protein